MQREEPVVERERNAVVGEAEGHCDAGGVGVEDLVHRVPLVVEQHLDVELIPAEPRAGDDRQCEHDDPGRGRGRKQRPAARRFHVAAGRVLLAASSLSSGRSEKMRGRASPQRQSRYCALVHKTPKP